MLRAPFPWFGGKSRAASVIWRAFGNVPNYVEPFAGDMPAGWTQHAWKAQNAFANAERERIWFSPHCLPIAGQGQLFAEAS